MSDPFLKLYKDKTDRQQRVGEWVINNIQPYLEHKNLDTVDLEIGCGHGHWLTSYSEIEQSKAFVGIDLITKRIEKSESKKVNDSYQIFFTRLKLMNLSNMPDSQLKIHILCIQILGQSLNIIKEDLFNYLF